ncbi:hypothetical protein GQ55_7G255800 [Panicum hallii var. hallii]|uniref:Uncharacterized protein n=1 Tax=Panicum hallii var. hallii TaxID=1504633 RepID=A0A2T7CZ36_9POAL|nr:hypothetical protein GQ55_7G255800 [Panicum hallii var. hallii]
MPSAAPRLTHVSRAEPPTDASALTAPPQRRRAGCQCHRRPVVSPARPLPPYPRPAALPGRCSARFATGVGGGGGTQAPPVFRVRVRAPPPHTYPWSAVREQ